MVWPNMAVGLTLVRMAKRVNLSYSSVVKIHCEMGVYRAYSRHAAKVADAEYEKGKCEAVTQNVCDKLEADGEPIPQDFIIHVKDTKEIYSIHHNVGRIPSATPPRFPSVTGPVKLVKIIRPDALRWRDQAIQPSELLRMYMKLSKIRLTSLIVITTMAGNAIAPVPFILSTFMFTAIGTGLTSCSANAINQFLEVPYDSQMSRTKARPLVKKQLSELHALLFAGVTAVTGLAILSSQVNLLTAGLGLGNLILYTSVYTPLKRVTIANTWVGAVVGAVPPVMGYTAATGSVDSSALLLAALLYCWQFPHFNALSWNLKAEYSRAGYRMMSVTAPGLCRATALRYSAGICLLCPLAPLTGATTWTFALDSLPPNIYLTYLAWRFYTRADSESSRKLFRFSLVHLPVIMVLLLLGKNRSIKQTSGNNS